MLEENNIIRFNLKLNDYISKSKKNITEDEKRYYERMISKLKADIFVEEFKLKKLKQSFNK